MHLWCVSTLCMHLSLLCILGLDSVDQIFSGVSGFELSAIAVNWWGNYRSQESGEATVASSMSTCGMKNTHVVILWVFLDIIPFLEGTNRISTSQTNRWPKHSCYAFVFLLLSCQVTSNTTTSKKAPPRVAQVRQTSWTLTDLSECFHSCSSKPHVSQRSTAALVTKI